MHNLDIDWKNQKLTLSCGEDHLPDLIPVEDEEEDVGHEKDKERLFRINIDAYIRATKSTDLAAEANKEKQKQTFEDVVPDHYHDFKDVFNKESFDKLLPNRPWDHTVELLPGDHVINCKTYNLTLDEQKELDAFLDENLKSGCIRPSKSLFASAFFFVKKKDGRLRPVQDYRKLNNITVKNRYPLPLISELIDKLKTATYFTKLNIRWGYNNIWMKDGDKWKAAFRTNRGLFEPLIMFFRLTNSPATFQTMMNHLFCDLINRGKVVVYMDDIMIFTTTLNEHRQIVREVLQLLRDNKLYLKHTKCEFEQLETEYLSLVVGHNSVRMDQTKVTGILEWPVPRTRKELQGFLGFLNFYCQFIQDFAAKARPLNALTSEKNPWDWTADCQTAFEALKIAVTTTPVLSMPTKTNPFRIETDGSGIGLGAVLSQQHNGVWHLIVYISHSLSDTERNYHAADLEMAAIIFALKEWRHYLINAALPFEILTDHQNLTYFKKPQDLNRRQARWAHFLQQYHFTMTHCSGKTNAANPLSRRSDFKKGVELDNKAQTLLPETLFSSPHSPEEDEAAVCSLQVTKQSNNAEAATRLSDSIESIVRKLQHKREKYAQKGLTKKPESWEEHDKVLFYKNLLYIPKETSL